MAQMIGRFEVPAAYEVWADGLYKKKGMPPNQPGDPDHTALPPQDRLKFLQRVTYSPIWIEKVGTAIEGTESFIKLAYLSPLRGQEVQYLWVQRLQISVKQKFSNLAAFDVPVTDLNVESLIDYLQGALACNGASLEHVTVASRSGIYKLPNDQYGWLIGENWVGPRGVNRVEIDPRRLHSFAKGYRPSAPATATAWPAAELWWDKFREISAYHPITRWLNCSAFAAPLLRLVNLRTFIICHWGASAAGKSAGMKFALSAWGKPHTLMTTFNRTEISITELFRYADSLIIGIDELQSSSSKEGLSKAIYTITNEKGRGRATRDGDLQQETESWRTIVRMTGEEPLVGKDGTIDLGGQANRVIQINKALMTSEEAAALHDWLETGPYGCAGLQFLQHLGDEVNAPHGLDKLLKTYKELTEDLRVQVSSGVFSRLTQLACIALAEYLILQWFMDYTEPMARLTAIQDTLHVAQIVEDDERRQPLKDQALSVLQDHFKAARHQWVDLSNPEEAFRLEDGSYRSVIGILHQDEVWLIQKEANDIFKRAGFPGKRVWHDFREAGIMKVPPSGDTFAYTRRRGNWYGRVYVLDRKKSGPWTAFDYDKPGT